uniref:Uncharacterized protein n=1 Tax=Tetranychus urticae TaxID=32264 RepID=T1KCC2_TETUR
MVLWMMFDCTLIILVSFLLFILLIEPWDSFVGFPNGLPRQFTIHQILENATESQFRWNILAK